MVDLSRFLVPVQVPVPSTCTCSIPVQVHRYQHDGRPTSVRYWRSFYGVNRSNKTDISREYITYIGSN